MKKGRTPPVPGTVVAVHGIRATVLLHEETGRRRVRCVPPRSREAVAVGDRVLVELPRGRRPPAIVSYDERGHSWWRALERGRQLLAANVDRVLVMGAVVPELKLGLVDRMLVAAELADVPAVLVLNKMDLAAAEAVSAQLDPYRALGYPVVCVSALTGAGVEALTPRLSSGVSVLVGHSGVGKSSLLNQLVPGLALRTGDVNVTTGKGRHVTSVATGHELGAPWPTGGLVVDTPGVRSFPLFGTAPTDVAAGYRELAPLRGSCHFRDCLHLGEPGCALTEPVAADGEAAPPAIDPGRYRRYHAILESLRAGLG